MVPDWHVILTGHWNFQIHLQYCGLHTFAHRFMDFDVFVVQQKVWICPAPLVGWRWLLPSFESHMKPEPTRRRPPWMINQSSFARAHTWSLLLQIFSDSSISLGFLYTWWTSQKLIQKNYLLWPLCRCSAIPASTAHHGRHNLDNSSSSRFLSDFSVKPFLSVWTS